MIRALAVLAVILGALVLTGTLKSIAQAVDDWQDSRDYNDYIIRCTGVDLRIYPQKGEPYETLETPEFSVRSLLADTE